MKVLDTLRGKGSQCMPPNCAKCISVQVKRGRLLQVSRADRTTDPVESSGWDWVAFGFWNYFPQKVEVVEFRIAILCHYRRHIQPLAASSCQPLSILLLPHVSGYDTMDNTNRVDIKMVGIDTSRV